MSRITVIGTGYVGLVTGTCLADFGHQVVCADNNGEKIAMLNQGDELPIYEPGLKAIVDRNVYYKRLSFTTYVDTAVRENEIAFIAVGTPPAEDGSADLQYVESVARQIGRNIDSYTVVVDKSTVPIGTGQKVKGWLQEELDARC